MRKRSLLLVLFLLVGVFFFSSVSAECNLTNHFVDESTGECVCDFGRGYADVDGCLTTQRWPYLGGWNYGGLCTQYDCIDVKDTYFTSGKMYVSSCGFINQSANENVFLSEIPEYILTKDINVLDDSFFNEYKTCFVISSNDLRFNLNGKKVQVGDGDAVYDSNYSANAIAVSGSNVNIYGCSPDDPLCVLGEVSLNECNAITRVDECELSLGCSAVYDGYCSDENGNYESYCNYIGGTYDGDLCHVYYYPNPDDLSYEEDYITGPSDYNYDSQACAEEGFVFKRDLISCTGKTTSSDNYNSFGKIKGFNGAGVYSYFASGLGLRGVVLENNYLGFYSSRNNSGDSVIDNVFSLHNSFGIVANPVSSTIISLSNFSSFFDINSYSISGFRNKYYVSTCKDLQNINNDLKGEYLLLNDIDCSGFKNSDGRVFTPINTFSGVLNGNGFVVKNLVLYVYPKTMCGEWSCSYYRSDRGFIASSSGVIKNIGFVNATYPRSENGIGVGGIVGVLNAQGVIENSFFSGNIGGLWHSGGLVAVNYGTISNSFSSGSVSAGYYASPSFYPCIGGVVGRNYGKILNSYSNASVSYSGGPGWWAVGGIIGENYGLNSKVVNSYFSGVTGSYGGFYRGDITYKNTGVINNSYSGNKDSWLYNGWDFNTVWIIDVNKNNGYPYLRNNSPIFSERIVGKDSFSEMDLIRSSLNDKNGIYFVNSELTADKATVVFPEKVYISNTSKLKVYDSSSFGGINDSIEFSFGGEKYILLQENGSELLDAITIAYNNYTKVLSFNANTNKYPALNVPFIVNSFSLGFPSRAIANSKLLRSLGNFVFFKLVSSNNPFEFSVNGFELCVSNANCTAFNKNICDTSTNLCGVNL